MHREKAEIQSKFKTSIENDNSWN